MRTRRRKVDTAPVRREPEQEFWTTAQEFEDCVVYDANGDEVIRFKEASFADAIVNVQRLGVIVAFIASETRKDSPMRRAVRALADVGITLDVREP